MPAGFFAAISAAVMSCLTISENTCASRTRRAISCAYCAPKSTTRTAPVSNSVTHAHALRFLQDLAFGLERRSNHDFGLLEFLHGLIATGGH